MAKAKVQPANQAVMETPPQWTAPWLKHKDVKPEPEHEPLQEFHEVPDVVPPPAAIVTDHKRDAARQAVAELARRRYRALNLYEPLPTVVPFHQSNAPERLIRGSNRAGKTLAAAIEVSRAMTGSDPHKKYPERDGRAYAVGKDGKHLGQVMYRKLFKAGAFKIIRDEITGNWRAFRPWRSQDLARQKEAKPAPPLIPPSMVKSVAWLDKKAGEPNLVTLHNGWELSFYTSLGEPPNGSDIDLAWFDEEIIHSDWYPEVSARLLDRRGLFIWSATPQAGSDELFRLHEDAERLRETSKPRVEEFVTLLDENPHIDAEAKQQFVDKMSDEERRVRVLGEFAVSGWKVYPEFSMSIHGMDMPEGGIPANWSRGVSVDPGRQICAVLFAAVPPPDFGDFVCLYDELYIQNCDAEQFGAAFATKLGEQRLQWMLIDHQAGRVREMGSGQTVEEQYAAALHRRKVSCINTGSQFTWGSSDVDGGLLAVRGWLGVRPDGDTKVRVIRGRLPNLENEFKRYRNKIVNGKVTDRPDKRHDHLMDDLRYIAMFNPVWIKPPRHTERENFALKYLRDKIQQRRARTGKDFVWMGPDSNH